MAKPKVTVEPFVAPSEPQAQPEETVTIDMGNGITRTLARGKGSSRVSDAVWAEAQRQARKELADKQKENSVDGLVERTDKVKKSADQAVDDAKLPGDDVDGLIERTQEVNKSSDKAVDDAKLPGDDVDGLIERTQKVSQDAQQTASDAKLPETPKSGKKQRFEVTPGELTMESADRRVGSGGLDPRALGGYVADLAMHATPDDPQTASRRKMIEEHIVPNFDGTLNGEVITSPEQLALVKQMSPSAQAAYIDQRSSLKGYQEAHPPAQLAESEQVPQPSLFDRAAHVIGQAPEALGAVLGGGKQPAQPEFADPVDTGDTKVDVPGQKVTPPNISMGGSVSVSSKTPGNAKVPVAPKDNYAAQLDANAKLQEDILKRQTEQTSLELKAKADLVRQESTEKSRLALENQQRMNAEMGEMKKHEDGLRDLQQQVLQASRESIDPDRYWNSRDTGQKIAGVLAGALFGFTGQGMQWLQRVDSLVAQDMQAQASDLARKRGYLQDATGLQNNIIAQAEAKGLKGDAAYKAAVITMKENIADQIMLNAMNYADPQLRLKAEQQAADIRMSTEKEKMEYGNLMKTRALDAGLKVAQMNHLNAQTEAARIAARGGGSAKSNEMPPGIRTEIAKIDLGLKAVKEAREAIGGRTRPDQKFFDQIALNIGDSLRAVGMSAVASGVFPDTSQADAEGQGAQENVLKAVKGENLLEADTDRARPRYLRPGFASENKGWLDSQERQLIEKRNSLLKSEQEGNLSLMQEPLLSLTPAKGK